MNYKIYSLIIFSLISTVTIAAEEHYSIKFKALSDAVRTTVANFIDHDNITKIEKVTDTGYVKFEILSTKTVTAYRAEPCRFYSRTAPACGV